ncbi:MAG: hypothetical protein JNL40_08650 [Cyclobacteriaceae bacterium]|nr:hypothetical protein [Cyclobacteriaceae bacterium]
MTKKILLTLTTLILVILPFLVGIPIGQYSPYVDSNSFKTYVIIWTAISLVFVVVALAVSKYYKQSFGSLLVSGLLLFLLICPIIGITGLAAAPDLSIKMLEHPEREHLRYIFLFLAALLFGTFPLVLLKRNSLEIKNVARLIMTLLFILAFVESIWEFTHHYLYPEALKEWIDHGNHAEEFGKSYDNLTVITIVAVGRLIHFSLVIWLSIQLYRLQHIKLWSPILTILFSLVGLASAIVIYITQMNIPKGFEILFLFFIPGIPFLLLYWLGVGIVTKVKKSEVAV